MSHGRFDNPLTRNADGTSVEACGPIHWNGDETNDGPAQTITIKHIEIKQHPEAKGTKHLDSRFQRGDGGDDDPEWMGGDVHADGDHRFVDGPADAKAKVEIVLEGQTDAQNETWHEQVEISH